MYRNSLFPIFYAADNGTAVAVPAENSPTAAPIEVTPRTGPPPAEIHQLESIDDRPVRQRGVKVSKVDVAKELGLEKSPSESIEEEAARVRDEKGRFIKKDPEIFKGSTDPKQPVIPLGEPKPATKPAAKAEPTPTPTQPTPTKIKVDGKEMTEEEVAAELKSLREKVQPAPASPMRPPTPTPEAPKAMTREEWIAQQVNKPDIDEKALDKILSGGPEAVKAFCELRAKDKAETREFLIGQIQPVVDAYEQKIAALEGRVTPLADTWQQNTAQQNADKFMTAHPDIKGHAKGYDTMVETAAELNDEYGAIQGLLSANPNAPFAKAYKARLDQITGDNFFKALADESRAKLGLNGQPQPVAQPTPVAIEPTPTPKPLRAPPQGGTLGVTGTPKKGNSGGVQELMNHHKW